MHRRRRSTTSSRAAAGGNRGFVGSGNDAFLCLACGAQVLPLVNGSFRSHCPECLWSRHVDVQPGDRRASCGGLMRPVAVEGSTSTGWSVVHLCLECGARRRNKAAENDRRQPDRWERILEISRGGEGELNDS